MGNKHKYSLILIAILLVSCGTIGLVNKKKVKTDFCYLSGNDMICYKQGKPDAKGVVAPPTVKSTYIGGCKDMQGYVLIPVQVFEELTK
jgi:hypothetical protein